MEGVPTKLLGVATLSKDVSEQRTLTGSVGFFSILGQRLSSKFRANRLYKNLILKRHRAIQFVSVKAYLKGKRLTSGWRASLKIKKRFCFKSHFTLQKKPGPDPLKSGPDQFFLTVYTGNKQVRLIIEKCIVHKRKRA